ncbi:hypothetical protein TeGR_g3156, partial [Tetraparma gracilis]
MSSSDLLLNQRAIAKALKASSRAPRGDLGPRGSLGPPAPSRKRPPPPPAADPEVQEVPPPSKRRPPSALAVLRRQSAAAAERQPPPPANPKRPVMIRRPSALPAPPPVLGAYAPFARVFGTPSSQRAVPPDFAFKQLLRSSLSAPPALPASLPARLPLRYPTAAEYQSHALPLLLLEMHAELLSSLREGLQNLALPALEGAAGFYRLSQMVGDGLMEGSLIRAPPEPGKPPPPPLPKDGRSRRRYEHHTSQFRPNDVLLLLKES